MRMKIPRTSFFKIEAPDKKPIIILTKNGYWGLTAILNSNIPNSGNTYITSISLWEAIKYILKKKSSVKPKVI